MPGGHRTRVSNIGSRHYVRPHIEHNDQFSKRRTHHVRHSTNKVAALKKNDNGSNYHGKSLDSKPGLFFKQLGSTSNCNEPSTNNLFQRNQDHGVYDKYRKPIYNLEKSCSGWYSIFIPNAEDCEEILDKIESYIHPVLFYPYNKTSANNELKFLVDNYDIAKKLQLARLNIKLRDNQKLKILVREYFPRHQTISYTPVSSIIKENIVKAMATRYDPSAKSLDLSRFYACIFFTENQLFVPLNRPSVLLATLNIAAQYTKHELRRLSLENNHIYLKEGLVWIRRLFPKLKALDLTGNNLKEVRDLNKLSGYSIEVLNLSKNPVCYTKNQEKFIMDIQKLFPMLNKLDNLELPCKHRSIFETMFYIPINQDYSYPIPKGHNPEQQNPTSTSVELFITQFYSLYDNKVRKQVVSEAYHENATFSLSSSFLFNPSKGSLAQYEPDSRNLISGRLRKGKNCLLKKGKKQIMNLLEKLPLTKHDLSSFFIDVPFSNSTMIQIVINGVFAENFEETSPRPLFRSFCRTFIIVYTESSWYILSDLMFVTMVTYELMTESSKRFYNFMHKEVSSITDNVGCNKFSIAMWMENIDELPGSTDLHTKNLDSPISIPSSPEIEPPSKNTPLDSERLISALPVTVKHQTTQNSAMNSINGINSCSDSQMSMIKRFSSESGMYPEWSKKCLEENNWDYAKAFLCFSKLKPNIPAVAYIR